MNSLNVILREVDNLQDSELHLLLHVLIDKIHTPLEVPEKAVNNPFRKYRRRAKGIWRQDAQEYVNELRNEERF
jgi:hypothetical protein